MNNLIMIGLVLMVVFVIFYVCRLLTLTKIIKGFSEEKDYLLLEAEETKNEKIVLSIEIDALPESNTSLVDANYIFPGGINFHNCATQGFDEKSQATEAVEVDIKKTNYKNTLFVKNLELNQAQIINLFSKKEVVKKIRQLESKAFTSLKIMGNHFLLIVSCPNGQLCADVQKMDIDFYYSDW